MTDNYQCVSVIFIIFTSVHVVNRIKHSGAAVVPMYEAGTMCLLSANVRVTYSSRCDL